MDYLESVVLRLEKKGGLTVRGENGYIDLALILEEAVKKDILPRDVLKTIGRIMRRS